MWFQHCTILICFIITSSIAKEISHSSIQHEDGALQRIRRNDPTILKSPVSMANTGGETTNSDDNEDLKIGLIVGGICAILVVLGLAILSCRCYDKHESLFYPVEKRTRLSQVRREEQEPYTMIISPDAEIIELDETDGNSGDAGRGFEKPLTTFQPYTGTFTSFPGKGSNFTSNNRDSGISLLDILDERDKTAIIDEPIDESTFAREGTVHNPLFQDTGGIDNPAFDDDRSTNGKDSETVGYDNDDNDDYPNLFEDIFSKEPPVTLLSYAKKHVDEQQNDAYSDADTMSYRSGQSATTDDLSNNKETTGLDDYNQGQGSDSLNKYEDIKERKYEDIRDAINNKSDSEVEEPNYATIQRNSRPPAFPDSPNNSSPEPDESESPKESPPLLRTGSVAKLVNAFLTGDIKKTTNDDEDNASGPVEIHPYKNPAYQREKQLLRSYSNPPFEDDTKASSDPNHLSKQLPVELTDENNYLKAVDDSPIVETRLSDPTSVEEDTFKQYLDQSGNADTDDDAMVKGLRDSGDFTPNTLGSTGQQPELSTNEPIESSHNLQAVDQEKPKKKSPVPAPRRSIKIVATSRISIKGDAKSPENINPQDKPTSKPPPPPTSMFYKPTKSLDEEDTGSPTKKKPPPVAPKQFSVKRTPGRSLTVQPIRRAPAPPPRVPSLRY